MSVSVSVSVCVCVRGMCLAVSCGVVKGGMNDLFDSSLTCYTSGRNLWCIQMSPVLLRGRFCAFSFLCCYRTSVLPTNLQPGNPHLFPQREQANHSNASVNGVHTPCLYILLFLPVTPFCLPVPEITMSVAPTRAPPALQRARQLPLAGRSPRRQGRHARTGQRPAPHAGGSHGVGGKTAGVGENREVAGGKRRTLSGVRERRWVSALT